MSFLNRAFLKAYQESAAVSVPATAQPASPPRASTGNVASSATIAPPAPSIERKPASSRIVKSDEGEFVVRHWSWPRITQQLLNQSDAGFRHVARSLLTSATKRGEKVVAIASSGPREGCSSVFMTLLKVLSETPGTRVLGIDANLEDPSLISLMQLGMKGQGTPHVLANYPQQPLKLFGASLWLLPLLQCVSPDSRTSCLEELTSRLNDLKSTYDLILVDAGSIPTVLPTDRLWAARAVDAVINISHSNRQISAFTAEREALWKSVGITSLGVIETFA